MFHPERLTGKRARKYAKSISYAPPAQVPKVLMKKIRAPAEHVKYVLHLMPHILDKVRAKHYVVVIRNKVVMVNHEDQVGERCLAELSGVKKWRCKCYTAMEMYGTHTRVRQVVHKGRPLGWAETKADLPEDMIALRLMCKKPVTEHRTTYYPGNDKRFKRENGDTVRAPYAAPNNLQDKFNRAGLSHKITERAATLLGSAVSREKPHSLTAILSGTIALKLSPYQGIWRVSFDPYTWYCRVYSKGLAVLDDWFVLGATRDPEKEDQQDATVVLPKNERPVSFQYATAVSLKRLVTPPMPGLTLPAPVAVGVLVRPAPGLSWFVPAPRHKSDEWLPSQFGYSYRYNVVVDHNLAKYYPVRPLHAAAQNRTNEDQEEDLFNDL